MARWKSSVYKLRASSGKKVEIDVTTSVAASLPPHQVLKQVIIPNWKKKKLNSVLDFGAGALRHTFPLLRAGFQVCAVEFESAFSRPVGQKALKRARRSANFSELVWPHEFNKNHRKFDAALLCFVLQTMPVASERKALIKYIYKKLNPNGYLLYLSRYTGIDPVKMKPYELNDGYFMWPDRNRHSFFTIFTTERTHEMFEEVGFRHVRSPGARGSEQVFVYGKGKGGWI